MSTLPWNSPDLYATFQTFKDVLLEWADCLVDPSAPKGTAAIHLDNGWETDTAKCEYQTTFEYRHTSVDDPLLWCEKCLALSEDTSSFGKMVRVLVGATVVLDPARTREQVDAAHKLLTDLTQYSVGKPWSIHAQATLQELTLLRVKDDAASPEAHQLLVATLVTEHPEILFTCGPASEKLLEVLTGGSLSSRVVTLLAEAFARSVKLGESSVGRPTRLREVFERTAPKTPSDTRQLKDVPAGLLDPTAANAFEALVAAWRKHVQVLFEETLLEWEALLVTLDGPSTHLLVLPKHPNLDPKVVDLEGRIEARWPSWRQEHRRLMHVPEPVGHAVRYGKNTVVPYTGVMTDDIKEAFFSLWTSTGGTIKSASDALEMATLTNR